MIILPAATVTNRIRLLEHWMKEGGLDLDKRGPAFEQHLRHGLISSVARGPLGRATRILSEGQRVVIDGEEVEIDLVLVLGRTILLGELKCFTYPVTPLELFNYRKTMDAAQTQIARKTAAVASGRELFLRQIPELSDCVSSEGEVIPVVVSNLPFGVGKASGPAVVDRFILERFFEDGYLDTNVVFSKEGRRTQSQRAYFYSSAEEAERELPNYLQSPPQIQVLESRLLLEVRQLPLLAAGEFEIEHWTLETPEVRLGPAL